MKFRIKPGPIFIFLVIFFYLSSRDVMPSMISKKTKEGIEQINSMQNKTIADIKKNSKVNKVVHIEESSIEDMIDESINSSAYTINDYKEFFNNTVFMGDSLTEPLYYYEFLNSTSVVAEKGKNVMSALEDDVSKAGDLAPDRVIMLYGMNDLNCFNDLSDFAKNYKILIDSVKERLPDAEIIVISTLYVTSEAEAKDTTLSRDRNNEANSYIKEMCHEEDITYLDLRSITSKKSNLYEPDGIHVVADFYNIYLDVLMKILKGE